jgi:hypothetical protein
VIGSKPLAFESVRGAPQSMTSCPNFRSGTTLNVFDLLRGNGAGPKDLLEISFVMLFASLVMLFASLSFMGARLPW